MSVENGKRMTIMVRYVLVLMLALLMLGCENESPQRQFQNITSVELSQEQMIQASTTKSQYLIGEQMRISIYNGSDSIVYLPTCSRQVSYYLQKKINGIWEDTGGNGVPCVGFNSMGKVTLFSGRSYVYYDAFVHFGTYRMRYLLTLGRSSQTVWLYTNEFSVDGR